MPSRRRFGLGKRGRESNALRRLDDDDENDFDDENDEEEEEFVSVEIGVGSGTCCVRTRCGFAKK